MPVGVVPNYFQAPGQVVHMSAGFGPPAVIFSQPPPGFAAPPPGLF